MRGMMMDFPLTLVPILERAGKLYQPDRNCFAAPGPLHGRTTYGEMYRRARRLARALEFAGSPRGDRVATLMWNHSGASGMLLRYPRSPAALSTR